MVRPRTKIFIGELLATLPLREFNLRSKVAVFWKALLMLYVTALSVRHLSPKPGGAPHLKNVAQIPPFLATSLCNIPPPSIPYGMVRRGVRGGLGSNFPRWDLLEPLYTHGK